MPDIIGSKQITIRRGEHFNIDLTTFSCSTSATDDGRLPYNTTVSSVGASAYDVNDNIVTDIINGVSAIQTFPANRRNVISTPIKYPNINGVGDYRIRWGLDLSNGYRIITRYHRIKAKS